MASAAPQDGEVSVMQACGCGSEDSRGAVYSGVGGRWAAV